MFNFSSGEIVIILVLALIFCRPEDLSAIAKKAGNFKKWIDEIYDEIAGYIYNSSEDSGAANQSDNSQIADIGKDERDKLNFYITEILRLGGNIDSEYDITSLREQYLQLLEKKLNQDSSTRDNNSDEN